MSSQQIRAMIDTNVYALLYMGSHVKVSDLAESGRLVVYGCKLIRKELREIPVTIKVDNRSYRNALLGIYDKLAGKHDVPVGEVSQVLAKQYLKEYKGGSPMHKIYPDFLIVATATIHNLDLIVSEDEKTMKSTQARIAYGKVNSKTGLRTPEFTSLAKLTL